MTRSEPGGGPPQMSLGGFEPPVANDRLFFAVFPDADTASRLAALGSTLRHGHGLRGKVLAADRLHVTLHHLGDHAVLPPALVEAARKAGDRLGSRPFEVTFDSASSFASRRGSRPFVLRGSAGVDGIVDLQRELGQHMAATGLGRHVEASFTPHVTLLYDDATALHAAIDPISWRVDEVVLVRSLLGRHEHERLGSWPLAGQGNSDTPHRG